jgi:hypothetical protein
VIHVDLAVLAPALAGVRAVLQPFQARAPKVAQQCPTWQALEQEIAFVRHELATAGRDAPVVQSIDDNDRERELARWLSSARAPDAAADFRAGWRRLGQLAAPRLRDWEHLWWRSQREGDSLRSRIGELLREISRLTDGG